MNERPLVWLVFSVLIVVGCLMEKRRKIAGEVERSHPQAGAPSPASPRCLP